MTIQTYDNTREASDHGERSILDQLTTEHVNGTGCPVEAEAIAAGVVSPRSVVFGKRNFYLLDGETWLPINGHPSYSASDLGRLASNRHGEWRLLTPYKTEKGYLRVLLNKKKYKVHRVILSTFQGPCPEGMQCAHLDGNLANNRLSNLAWCSPKENRSHRYVHGTHICGVNSNLARLTEADVVSIKNDLARGNGSTTEIAKRYSTSPKNVRLIRDGKTWKHIGCATPADTRLLIVPRSLIERAAQIREKMKVLGVVRRMDEWGDAEAFVNETTDMLVKVLGMEVRK